MDEAVRQEGQRSDDEMSGNKVKNTRQKRNVEKDRAAKERIGELGMWARKRRRNERPDRPVGLACQGQRYFCETKPTIRYFSRGRLGCQGKANENEGAGERREERKHNYGVLGWGNLSRRQKVI